MKLFPHDAYQSLTRVFRGDEAVVALDVGGNEGHTARRMLGLWPAARVVAFEPSPAILPVLKAEAAKGPGFEVVEAAVGSREGKVSFHVTGDHWCSSVLPPSELGKRYYGSWLEVSRKVEVPLVTLDGWTGRNGVKRVDLIKVDTQGYDLEVLKGAEGLLRTGGVRAVNCEFQFAPEYEGCSTFSEIDQYMKGLGFCLYQIHEVWTKGNEEQTSCGDGLWLKAEVLAELRGRRDLPDLTPAGRMRRAMAERGVNGPVAVYGAGRHTRQALPALGESAGKVVAVIDDNPALRGTAIEGKPVIDSREAMTRGLSAVVLSSDVHEAALWRAAAGLRAKGVEVIALYGRYEG